MIASYVRLRRRHPWEPFVDRRNAKFSHVFAHLRIYLVGTVTLTPTRRGRRRRLPVR
jgi:hypothetical protein